MNLEILISCMHQKDLRIAELTGVHCDTLIINQTDTEDYEEKECDGYRIRMVSTMERGLSRSRNMALQNSLGDICLICDDDETLAEDYVSKIITAFENNPDADIITFSVTNPFKNFPHKFCPLGMIGILKTCSWQIAFRRKSIMKNHIFFDVNMGSGTGNGGGEENKFLMDCRRKNLKIFYVPENIGSVAQTQSQWFKGHTDLFFLNRGYSCRKILGFWLTCLYIFEYSIAKYPLYKKENTFCHALYYQFKGMLKK